jgi:hypothetical protein
MSKDPIDLGSHPPNFTLRVLWRNERIRRIPWHLTGAVGMVLGAK